MSALFVVVLMLLSGKAQAACASPAEVRGELRWISPEVKFCDGTGWNSTTVTTTATNCTNTGEITYASNTLYFCNGAKLVQMNGTTNGTCTAGQAGTIQYSSGVAATQYCNGTNWIVTRPTAAAAALARTVSASSSVPSNRIVTAAFTGGTTGNFMVCAFGLGGSYTISGVTDTNGNTYTRVGSAGTAFPGYSTEVWYAQNITTSSSLTVSATYASGANGIANTYNCMEFSGMQTSNVLDQFTYTNGTTGNATATLTTTTAKELLVVVTLENNLCGNGTGWTDNTGNFGDYIGYMAVNSLGSNTTTTGSGCGSPWTMHSMSFRSN